MITFFGHIRVNTARGPLGASGYCGEIDIAFGGKGMTSLFVAMAKITQTAFPI
jgi:hypothetical protein